MDGLSGHSLTFRGPVRIIENVGQYSGCGSLPESYRYIDTFMSGETVLSMCSNSSGRLPRGHCRICDVDDSKFFRS